MKKKCDKHRLGFTLDECDDIYINKFIREMKKACAKEVKRRNEF